MSIHLPGSSVTSVNSSGSLLPAGPKRAFFLVTALFFLWGMSNNVTDILVQQFRISRAGTCELCSWISRDRSVLCRGSRIRTRRSSPNECGGQYQLMCIASS